MSERGPRRRRRRRPSVEAPPEPRVWISPSERTETAATHLGTKEVLDFIVIGAQKSGTTTLFEYMRRHPELCLPVAKEVPYFSNDTRYREEWTTYLRKAFPFSDPECRWGTVTPQYMCGGILDP